MIKNREIDFLRKVEFWLSKLIRRLLFLFGSQFVFRSREGIKSINAKLTLQPLNSYSTANLSPSQLFLFVDGLQDKDSLVGLNISVSPHVGLISCLSKQESIKDTDYVRRAERGLLDSRTATFYGSKYYQQHFDQLVNDHRLNKVKPILTFELENKYYILDGKHRAAYAAYLNQDIAAIIIPKLKGDPLLKKIYQKITESNPDKFKKNFDLLNSVLDIEKINDN